jgi:protease-4
VGSFVLREPVVEGSGADKIAVVPVAGIIDENMSKIFDAFLDQAEKDEQVKGVIVEIDSPGGTVTASDEMYARLLRFKQDKKVPVVVSMGSLATSGGYYTACAGDHIFAQETTLTGNIGVLMPRFNFHKLMDKWGVEENTIVSEGAVYKNAGSTFSEEQPHETKYLQSIADSMFKRFKDVVVAGRGTKLQALNLKIEQVADGRAFTATEAKANGLVDDIGYLGDAITHTAKAAGLTNPPVFRYTLPNPGLLTVLFGANGSSLPASNARYSGSGPGITVNHGVNVNVDRKLLEELAAPRVLYLWRGQ